MTLFKDFLKERAKFYSPPTGTTGHQTGVSYISPLRVQEIQKEWVPTIAWKDADLIENLLKLVDDHLGDRVLPPPETTWERRFEPGVDDDGTLLSWSVNKQKSDAVWMVRFGAINALGRIMNHLGRPIHVVDQSVEPDEEQKRTRGSSSSCKSKADYALLGKQGKVLVQVEAPNIMDSISSAFESASRRIFMEINQPLPDRIISKMCLYMGAHRVNWLALTSHHKWVFLRLHNDPEEAYLTYSSIITQKNDTRPFRALLGMMLATEFEIEVECKVTRTGPLPPIEEEEEEEEEETPPDNDKEDKSGSYEGPSRGTREDPPVPRPKKQPTSSSLLISWSRQVADHDYWFVCDPAMDSDWCPRFTKSKGPVQLRLTRAIGEGATSIVYEAKIDIDGKGEDPYSRSFAVKLVQKNNSEDTQRFTEYLRKEFRIYHAIEQAKQEGKLKVDIVPRCYGLFECKEFLALIMDYGGRAMTRNEWQSLEFEDKIEIFNLVLDLHKIGIGHFDLRPPNILRCDDGTFKIIDFTLGAFHECKGSADVSWYLKYSNKIRTDDDCLELNEFWVGYMKRYAPKKKKMNGTQ